MTLVNKSKTYLSAMKDFEPESFVRIGFTKKLIDGSPAPGMMLIIMRMRGGREPIDFIYMSLDDVDHFRYSWAAGFLEQDDYLMAELAYKLTPEEARFNFPGALVYNGQEFRISMRNIGILESELIKIASRSAPYHDIRPIEDLPDKDTIVLELEKGFRAASNIASPYTTGNKKRADKSDKG